jgi:hypothetical protein
LRSGAPRRKKQQQQNLALRQLWQLKPHPLRRLCTAAMMNSLTHLKVPCRRLRRRTKRATAPARGAQTAMMTGLRTSQRCRTRRLRHLHLQFLLFLLPRLLAPLP